MSAQPYFPQRRTTSQQRVVTAPKQRIQLANTDVYSLKPNRQSLYVLSGQAWITVYGEDIILNAGEALTLLPNDKKAVISALGKTPTVIEIA